MSQRKEVARSKARSLVGRARKQLSSSISKLVECGLAEHSATVGKAMAELEPVIDALGEPPPKTSKPKATKASDQK